MENKKKLLEETELFVLDMDGTFYLGDKILEGSLNFIEKLRANNKKFIFFTNNSSKSSSNYIKKLEGMNCKINSDQIMTSGDVTIEYIKTNYGGKKVYLVGTKELEESFIKSEINITKEKPHIVVIGFDTTLTYEKLEKACTYIREGAIFLATHLDVNCPMENGFIPDCGAFCAAISLSTGVEPKFLGKPFAETVEMLEKKTGVNREKMSFVGDRLYTDVATGVNNGAKGILVLSGETKIEDVEKSKVQPNAIFKSIGEMGTFI